MASTGQITDPEIANAFQELSLKKAQAESQIRISNAQKEAILRKIQHSVLVEKEVMSFTEDTKMYKSVGRMFLLQNQTEIKEDLKRKQTNFSDKIKSLDKSKEYLERNIEEFKNNVRELVMNKQHSR